MIAEYASLVYYGYRLSLVVGNKMRQSLFPVFKNLFYLLMFLAWLSVGGV